MIRAADMSARNKRVALILVAAMAFLCLGSVAYIDWYHAAGPGFAARQE